MSTWCWVISPIYDLCSFWSVTSSVSLEGRQDREMFLYDMHLLVVRSAVYKSYWLTPRQQQRSTGRVWRTVLSLTLAEDMYLGEGRVCRQDQSVALAQVSSGVGWSFQGWLTGVGIPDGWLVDPFEIPTRDVSFRRLTRAPSSGLTT